MSAPIRTLFRMSLFSLLVLAIGVLFREPLGNAFATNPLFNGLILGAFGLGLASNFRQVVTLVGEQRWLTAHRHAPATPQLPAPRLLAPMARLLGQPGGDPGLSGQSLPTLLEGIRLRLDEVRDLSRYLIGLLIFLGLLGTFWELLRILESVARVMEAMDPVGDELNGLFLQLQTGLREPLGGMGSAFGSFLLGLVGALGLGFVDLQAGSARHRFLHDLEKWLAGLTRLHSGRLDGSGEAGSVQALLEQNACQLERLGRLLTRDEEERRIHTRNLHSLATQVATLTEQMRGERELLLRLLRLNGDPETLASRDLQQDLSRQHLHNIEQLLQRLLRATRHSPDAMALALQRELAPLVGEPPPRRSDNTVELPIRQRR